MLPVRPPLTARLVPVPPRSQPSGSAPRAEHDRRSTGGDWRERASRRRSRRPTLAPTRDANRRFWTRRRRSAAQTRRSCDRRRVRELMPAPATAAAAAAARRRHSAASTATPVYAPTASVSTPTETRASRPRRRAANGRAAAAAAKRRASGESAARTPRRTTAAAAAVAFARAANSAHSMRVPIPGGGADSNRAATHTEPAGRLLEDWKRRLSPRADAASCHQRRRARDPGRHDSSRSQRAARVRA